MCMKKLSFMALAAAGLLAVGCASNDDVAVEQTTVAEEDGNQFIALNINLPVDNSTVTRNATDTDDNNYGDGNFELNDGLESEYTVNDATLVVFRPSTATGATEYDATFVAAYDINPEPWKKSTDLQVTDYSTKIVQKVGTTVQEGDLALVILNKNSLFALDTDNKFKVGSTEFTTSKTFGDLQKSLATAANGGTNAAAEMVTNGFYMANSPLTDKQGSTATVPTGATTRTLVAIKNVYETEQAARDGESAEIYVERGMAKVTLDGAITTPKLTTQYGVGVEGVTAADLNVSIDGWTLDHTNETSYLVRSTEGHSDFIGLINADANKYRYIGKTDIVEGIADGDTYKYRTYFAKDPNYEAATTPTTFGVPLGGLKVVSDVTASGVLSTKFGETNPQYCFENTFDVAHQSVNNTTLVRLKVTAKTGATGENLYIVNGNKSSIYKETDVKTLIANKCVELVKAAGVESKSSAATDEIKATDFTVTLGARDADGFQNIGGITFDISSKVSSATSSLIPAADDLLANVKKVYKDNTVGKKNGSILCYEGGVSYYTIRIKHFGDQLTPWKKSGSSITPVPSLTDGSYPNWNSSDADDKLACDKNYLGRYGVLRNNWYNLKIQDIKYLGEAVPVSYSNDPTPDDEIEGYIAVKINILSWAKRTQNWRL